MFESGILRLIDAVKNNAIHVRELSSSRDNGKIP